MTVSEVFGDTVKTMLATQKKTMREVQEKLAAPGSMFEMTSIPCAGGSMRVWKHGPQTLNDVLVGVEKFDDRDFVVYGDERITYRGFRLAVGALAAELHRRGIERGDVVALVMPNLPEWIVAWFAIAAVGGICAPVSPFAQADDLRHMLALSGARLILSDGDRFPRVLAAMQGADVQHIVTRARTDAADADMLESILGATQAWSDLAGKLAPVAVSPDDPAMIFFTAGTTGLSKGVLLSHRACAYSVFHAAFRNARSAALVSDGRAQVAATGAGQQVLLLPIPLFHVSGSLNPVLPFIQRGGCIVLMKIWSAELALRLIERERAHILGAVPTMIEQVLAHPGLGKFDTSSLQQVIYGGAPCSPTLALRLAERGLSAGQSYGMTETASGVLGHIGEEYRARPYSCGLPAPVHELRVVRPSGEIAPPGQAGELQIRGPQIMLGYWNDPALTTKTLRDGWLSTGDIAYIDDDGYCFVIDRAKDMIICAGENVYCSEIENALGRHPAVAEAAALGLHHDGTGEQPVAVVVLHEGAQANEDDLRSFLASMLQRYKVPAKVVFSAKPLPRNEAGKVRKTELCSLFSA